MPVMKSETYLTLAKGMEGIQKFDLRHCFLLQEPLAAVYVLYAKDPVDLWGYSFPST